MKNLNRLNYFMTGFPIAAVILGCFFEETLIYIGIMFTVITGLFHVIVALGIFIDSGFKHFLIRIYLIITILFFLLWSFTSWDWIVALPAIFAFYLSALLFIEAKK